MIMTTRNPGYNPASIVVVRTVAFNAVNAGEPDEAVPMAVVLMRMKMI